MLRFLNVTRVQVDDIGSRSPPGDEFLNRKCEAFCLGLPDGLVYRFFDDNILALKFFLSLICACMYIGFLPKVATNSPAKYCFCVLFLREPDRPIFRQLQPGNPHLQCYTNSLVLIKMTSERTKKANDQQYK